MADRPHSECGQRPGTRGRYERALRYVPVPSYILDTLRHRPVDRILPPSSFWATSAAGTSPPSSARRTAVTPAELFARKILGTAAATEANGVLVSTAGKRLAVEINAVPLMGGERVVGVFGLLTGPPHDAPRDVRRAPDAAQAVFLRLLDEGLDKADLAQDLHLSPETVRNPVPPSPRRARGELPAGGRRRRTRPRRRARRAVDWSCRCPSPPPSAGAKRHTGVEVMTGTGSTGSSSASRRACAMA